MDKKRTEKIIEDTLNSEKPDRKILSAAKEVMAKNRPNRAKNLRRVYALAGCSVVLIITGIIFAITGLSGDGTGFTNSSAASSGAESCKLISAISSIAAGALFGVIAIVLKIKNK